MRRYAEDTKVPVARSRSEIDKLLYDWGADAIQWSDDLRQSRVTLRFLWTWEGHQYVARFSLQLSSAEDLRKEAIDRRTHRPSDRKLEALMRDRGRIEHRALVLWLKAAFNAVRSGIVSAESLFLAFFEGRDGQTVGEVALPRFSGLLTGSAVRLLPLADMHHDGADHED
jgi:hypothetical protein